MRILSTTLPLLAVLAALAAPIAAQPAYVTLPPSADATTNADQPTVNFGGSTELDFGKDFVSSPNFRTWFTRGHVLFDLSPLQGMPRPLRARLWWNQDGARTTPAGCLAVAVHRITSAWSENTVTWTTNPTFDATVVTREDVGGWNCNGWHVFDVSSLVDGWLAGSWPNLGMLIRDDGEISAGAARPGKGFSREAAAAVQPYLELSWGVAFGAGCPASPMPELDLASGAPQIGGSFSMASSGLGASAPSVLCLGLSKTAWGAVPLPLPLASLGFAGCSLLVSPDLVAFGATDASGGRIDRFVVPRLPALSGLLLHLQALALPAAATLNATNGFSVRLF